MTREQVKALFPNASEAFLCANADPAYSRQDTQLERPAGHGPLAAHPREEGTAGRVHVCFTSARQRLCDPDNLSVKWLLDCLRYCGAIAGDEPDKITLEVRQKKVRLKSDEHTLIEIYE